VGAIVQARPSGVIGRRRRRTEGCAAAIGVLACLAANVAAAQVIEIDPDGATSVFSAPTVFTLDGAQAITPTLRPAAATPRPAAVQALIAEAAVRQRLSPDLISEVAWRESRYRQAAVSPRDAVGVMQLTAGTARMLGVDRYDAGQNIHGGAAYLRGMLDRYGGDLRLALAAYNAGPGAVDRYRGVPPSRETRAYVDAILERLSQRATARVVPINFAP
jgi:soluble lytic murein transglycosylase-like protein